MIERPRKVTKEIAMRLGLAEGCQILYEKQYYDGWLKKSWWEKRRGTVLKLWTYQFVVVWEQGGYKEAFGYGLLFGEEGEKIQIIEKSKRKGVALHG